MMETAQLVSVMGTGLTGRGMESGPRMHRSADISPISVSFLVLVFPGLVVMGFILISFSSGSFSVYPSFWYKYTFAWSDCQPNIKYG